MEVELSPKSIARLADALAPRVAKIIRRDILKPVEDANQEWISTKEAALILGMTPGNLRRSKDKYPHIKNGSNDQGNLRFLRSALLESFAK